MVISISESDILSWFLILNKKNLKYMLLGIVLTIKLIILQLQASLTC